MPKPLRRRRVAVVDELARFLGDLRGSARVIRFIEGLLVHSQGEFAGRPFSLLQFQRAIVQGIFDPTTTDGRRAIREALLFLPRKNGKTQLCAALGVYMTFGDGEQGGQVVCAANSVDQARALFDEAVNMVQASPILAARAIIRRAKREIIDKGTRTRFRALASEAGTNHGLNLSCWIYDELHEAPNRDLYDVLRTATGARRQPLGVVISTAGVEKLSVLGELYNHAERVLTDPTIDPGFFAFLAEAKPTDAWDDEATWHKANPALGVFRSIEEIRDACARAKQLPGQLEAFKRLYLNMWVQSETSWLELGLWDECGGAIAEEDLAGAECFGGLDLSSVRDLTAFALVWRLGDRVAVRHWVWVPKDGIIEREHRDRVPYRRWADQGRLVLTPGNSQDHGFAIETIVGLAEKYRIRQIAFDRWGAPIVVHELKRRGLEVVEMGQGFASMNAPCKELERLVLGRRLLHGGCPLLRWQAGCARVASDPAGNMKLVKPDRMKESKRIDSIVAMVMAIDMMTRLQPMDLNAFFLNPLISSE